MPADVFVSYSSKDRTRVIEWVERLREAGVVVWIDQGGIMRRISTAARLSRRSRAAKP
jgi:hypothetical protein